MKTAAYALAEQVAGIGYHDLPKDVIHEAKRRIADVIGIGLSGSKGPAGRPIQAFAAEQGGAGRAVIWGSNRTTSPAFAALANGTMTFHMELDDVHRTSHTHPGVSVIPAAMALCEERGLSGKDLLLATVLGYEVEIRIGLSVSPSIYVDRTYLAPGTLGVFGAAAAASKLLGLDAGTTAGAIGTASYLGPIAPFESFRLGAAAKDTIMGWVNFCGLYAASLAAAGFIGPATSIEGEFGYNNTVAERCDVNRIYAGLGEQYEILRTGIKPYACCRQHHTAIDAILELKERYGLAAAEVAHISHRTFVVGSRGSSKKPASISAAKYSAPYTIAVALTFGRAWREQYTMELIQDQTIMELAAKVDVTADMALEKLYDEKWPSIVEVTTKDGRILRARRDIPRGEPEQPTTDAELKEKFFSLATDAVSPERAQAIWDTVFRLDESKDISELTALLKV
ncbi:MmgE/PrpD family protein [Paenibacillus xerothermodurans]|uniref:MmgE/PrpD family protein n=1 Tax=Paenibacillus xerothermodurans TaxID=1977292 RepID=A0A2W1NCW8_PAEXE|nr:MmgE/PrpD family protein [Paenibacillus xerothermodurans]PZE22347.1 MmgE/PrpD family protein [Paenibacillus xerothermodurans]